MSCLHFQVVSIFAEPSLNFFHQNCNALLTIVIINVNVPFRRWGKATYDYLNEILRSKDAVKLGVSQCSGYILSDQTVTVSFVEFNYIIEHVTSL